jgi:hypothetical protein
VIYKNPINLKSALGKFIRSGENIVILVPFIKIDALKELVNSSCVKSIVTRWNPRDLVEGSSDLELFNYCKENNISLFRNSKLHLKAFILDGQKAFIGSMNVSLRALSENNSLYNYEIGTIIDNLVLEDKLYFQRIINESELINNLKFEIIKAQVESLKKHMQLYPTDFDFSAFNILNDNQDAYVKERFLISSLPMTDSPKKLKEIYFEKVPVSILEDQCFVHDLINYSISNETNELDFWNSLKANFFSHPFIKAFTEYLEFEKSLGFTEVSKWFAEHTTTVPLPRRWDLNENTKILFEWIKELSNGKYSWDKPSFRQRLFCYDYYKNEVLPKYIERFKSLNVDNAHGFEAINKPALLCSIIDAFEENDLEGKVELTDKVLERFREYWNRYSISNAPPNAILPLYHLKRDGVWEIIYNSHFSGQQIKSMKQYKELIKYIRMNNDFYGLMVVPEFRNQLKKTLVDRYFRTK